MKKRNLLFACAGLVLVAGCGIIPTRLFQSTVPPPVTKPAEQLEAERRAAKLIAEWIAEPKELIPVAIGLSQSLGMPKQAIIVNNLAELPKAAGILNAEIQAGIVKNQIMLENLNKKLDKLANMKIEGTGFSILGPGMGFAVIALIVLGVVFPPIFTILAFAYRRLKQAAGIVAKQIEQVATDVKSDPETKKAMLVLKDRIGSTIESLSTKHAESLKATIKSVKVA